MCKILPTFVCIPSWIDIDQKFCNFVLRYSKYFTYQISPSFRVDRKRPVLWFQMSDLSRPKTKTSYNLSKDLLILRCALHSVQYQTHQVWTVSSSLLPAPRVISLMENTARPIMRSVQTKEIICDSILLERKPNLSGTHVWKKIEGCGSLYVDNYAKTLCQLVNNTS